MSRSSHILPPKWASNFLSWYCKPELQDEILGDLEEQFQKNYLNKGQRTAKWKFVLDVFRFFPPKQLETNSNDNESSSLQKLH